MKKPPERKVLLAAMVLLVAAGCMLARPAIGVQEAGNPLHRMLQGKG